jgi:integrase
MPRKSSPASYRLHKARNCAVVTIDGRNHYLGPYGSPESKEEYARLIAERFRTGDASPPLAHPNGDDLTINELVAKYWTEHVQAYHTKDGKPTDRQYHVRLALRPLCSLYGRTPACEFGPRKLKTVREEMIKPRIRERGSVNRRYINDHVGIVKRLFRWAVAEELVPVAVHQALEAVESIHKGRDPRVKEGKKIFPAPDEDVQATLKVVSPQIRAIIELLLLTGMRPDEATIMRPCDIDRSGPVWVYTPESHKTEHMGIEKIVLLGPKAQKILEPWLNRDPTAYLFDPRKVVEATHARRRNGKPATKKPKPRGSRQPRSHYDDESLCQAVKRACEKAGVAKWTPGQLRHNAGTRIRSKHGLEAAKLILGHQSMATTEIYAEKDMAKAIRITEEMG